MIKLELTVEQFHCIIEAVESQNDHNICYPSFDEEGMLIEEKEKTIAMETLYYLQRVYINDIEIR